MFWCNKWWSLIDFCFPKSYNRVLTAVIYFYCIFILYCFVSVLLSFFLLFSINFCFMIIRCWITLHILMYKCQSTYGSPLFFDLYSHEIRGFHHQMDRFCCITSFICMDEQKCTCTRISSDDGRNTESLHMFHSMPYYILFYFVKPGLSTEIIALADTIVKYLYKNVHTFTS